jgi:hypothetical protein
VKNGKLTGRITGNNCRCAQKVARLEKVYGNLNDYHLRAWGDTRGDHELLAAAQIRTGDTSTIRASAGIHRLSVRCHGPLRGGRKQDIRPHVCLGTSRSQ